LFKSIVYGQNDQPTQKNDLAERMIGWTIRISLTQ